MNQVQKLQLYCNMELGNAEQVKMYLKYYVHLGHVPIEKCGLDPTSRPGGLTLH